MAKIYSHCFWRVSHFKNFMNSSGLGSLGDCIPQFYTDVLNYYLTLDEYMTYYIIMHAKNTKAYWDITPVIKYSNSIYEVERGFITVDQYLAAHSGENLFVQYLSSLMLSFGRNFFFIFFQDDLSTSQVGSRCFDFFSCVLSTTELYCF